MDEIAQNTAFQNRARAKQLIDLTGFGMGDDIHPTDLDGVLEWKDKAYVFMEFKHEDAPFPVGQKLCLERMVDDAFKAGKGAIAILVRHHVWNCEQDINAAECEATEIYFARQWRKAKPGITVREITEQFLRDYGYKSPKYDWQKDR